MEGSEICQSLKNLPLLKLLRLKIKFCLLVLYQPTHFLPPKNYIARGKNILLFAAEKVINLPGFWFLSKTGT